MKKGKSLVFLGVLLVVIDQVIKVLVKTNMTLGESIPVLGNWFQLVFVENKGMAFGMSFGGVIGKYLLTAFRIILFCVLCWWISKLVKRSVIPSGAEESPVPTGVLVGLTLITAGAFGNIVDCLCYGLIFSESTVNAVATFGHYAPFMQGKVVDMFYFPLWTWPDWMPGLGGRIFFEPVFNFADSCVTVGAIYLILFHWKFFSKD
ncbi:MAG: lipoprotein signal peptidase [Bacteroidales bacterium]|nr:lipoprotein signal peptidase [Bacteroidales bacterium]